MSSPRPQLDASLVRFGSSSFSNQDWVGNFYPKGTKPADFLRLYAERYDTVEIDATYYAIPTPATVDGWAQKTPPHFSFAAKFPRSIVHGGEAAIPDPDRVLVPEYTDRERDLFLETITRLGDKLGALLLQFPYFSLRAFPEPGQFFERLDEFLTELPVGPRYAVEVRNRNWLTPDFAHLLRAHNAALVLVDQGWMPHADEIESRFDLVTSNLQYIRLLGDRKEIEAITQKWDTEVIDRRERLRRWANFLVRTVRRGVPTVVYVNNHYAGHAPTTVSRLMSMFDKAISEAD